MNPMNSMRTNGLKNETNWARHEPKYFLSDIGDESGWRIATNFLGSGRFRCIASCARIFDARFNLEILEQNWICSRCISESNLLLESTTESAAGKNRQCSGSLFVERFTSGENVMQNFNLNQILFDYIKNTNKKYCGRLQSYVSLQALLCHIQ